MTPARSCSSRRWIVRGWFRSSAARLITYTTFWMCLRNMTGRSTPSPTAATAPLLLRSVSAVMIADDENVPGRATLAAWGEALAELFTDTELVIIANGVSGPVALELEWLAADIPDLTIHFLAERIDRDAAQLVGLDTAIGDWI